MTEFSLNKQHLRESLIFCFNWKKSATEAHWMLGEVCDGSKPSNSTDESWRQWFWRFKSGDFSVKGKGRPSQLKKFEDDLSQHIMNQELCRTQTKLKELLQVTQQTTYVRLMPLDLFKITEMGYRTTKELSKSDFSARNWFFKDLK